MKSISFIINISANTREYVELLIRSLSINLDSKQHEILIFIDSDNENTYDYLKDIKSDFEDLKIITHKLKHPIGNQINGNLLVQLAKHDIVSYLHSDMVIGSHYDTNILSELEDDCILSATRVEPPLHGYSDYTITEDLGTDPTKFDIDKWNKYSQSVKSNRAAEYFFAPITFYKKVWQSIGGYDTLFRRSREDSDFVQRCVHAGIKLIQTWQANVYHFTCTSSRGKNWFDPNNEDAKKRVELQKIADGIEIRRFIKKWGGFNHGDSKLKKLDIDLVIKDHKTLNPMFLAQLEVYFSRVWIPNEEQKQIMINMFSNEHDPANQLLQVSDQDWSISKHLYRITDFNSIYKVGEPNEFNIKVEADFNGIDPKQDLFIQNVTRLGDIVEGSDPGMYELGCAKITIRNIKDLAQDQIKVENPPFDYSLLTIE